MKANVAIAIPTYGGIASNFYDFTIALISALQFKDIGFEFFTYHGDSLITRARNQLITRFYNEAEEKGLTHFLFLDSDIATDPNNIIKLVEWTLKYDIDVIGGAVPLKGFKDDLFQECQTFRLTYNDEQILSDNRMMKVDFLTTGLLLLTKKAVFDLIEDAKKKDHWYHSEYKDKKVVYDIFQTGWKESKITDKELGEVEFRHYLSEDWFLCNWLRDLGFDIIVDLDIKVWHRGIHDYRFCDEDEYNKISYCKQLVASKDRLWQVEDADDELINYIKYANKIEGFMSANECATLHNLAFELEEGLEIVEIGSYQGRSTSALGLGCKYGNKNKITAIDLWGLDIDRHEPEYKDSKYYDSFKQNMSKLGLEDLVTSIEGESTLVAKEWDKKRKIGILLIDAGHRYEDVKADFEAWYPYVVKGGKVIFHDYYGKFLGLVKFVSSQEGKTIECVDLIDTLYISKKL